MRVLYVKYNTLRKPEFRICTRIVEQDGKKYVEKTAENEKARQHLETIRRGYSLAEGLYRRIRLLPYEECGGKLRFAFLEGENFLSGLDERASLDQIIRWLRQKAQVVFDYNDEFKVKFHKTAEFQQIFGDVSITDAVDAVTTANIDSGFDNFIAAGENLFCIDYEWMVDVTTPVRYLEYRAVRYYYLKNRRSFPDRTEQADFLGKYGFSEREIELYEEMEKNFLTFIHGENYKYLYLDRYARQTIEFDIAKEYTEKQKLQQACAEKEKALSEMTAENADLIKETERLKGELAAHEAELSAVFSSESWKMTSALRTIGRCVRSSKLTFLPAKFVNSAIHFGPREAVSKTIRYIHGDPSIQIPDVHPAEHQEREPHSDTYYSVLHAAEPDGSIAVHLHLFYEDLLEEFTAYLKKMPFAFDLYVSCREGVPVKNIKQRLSTIKTARKIVVKNVPNRGRDIAPLYVWFGKEISRYDYFLHIQSKKSLYTEKEQVGWRQYSLNSLLGSEDIIRRIIGLFQQQPDIGLVFPDAANMVPQEAFSWLKNRPLAQQFFKEMNIPFEEGIFMYPAGSFFWARTDALRPLFDKHLTIDRFPEENGQTDGTMAHVLERMVYFVAKSRGYRQAILDYEEGLVRYGFSYKPFRPYFSLDEDAFCNELMQYEIISFDIFDTLITRMIDEPDDLFIIMGEKINKIYGTKIDFLKIRKQAERDSDQKRGAYTNIDDIYLEMNKYLQNCGLSSEELKKMEIELELQIAVPRVAVRNIYNRLKKAGKKIILVSDMYLTSDIVSNMLKKCGYDQWDQMYLSCETGLRKDADTIWDRIFEEYPYRMIGHIGDNVRSDWQTLIDRGRAGYWIWNSRDMQSISASRPASADPHDINSKNAMGLFFNAGLFNSPFAFNEKANAVVKTPYSLGFTVFGPILFEFVRWLDYVTPDDAVLAFLAREGYVLQKIYSTIHETLEDKGKENYYLLASRRTVTVASINTLSDVDEILRRKYKGGVVNLFKSRLGIDPDIDDFEIEYKDLDDNIRKICHDLLEKHQEEYLAQFYKEKEGYLFYLEKTVPKEKWEKMYLVDVGYEGTIQYFMTKLLDIKVKGAYLAIITEAKPERLGCKVERMYDKENEYINQFIFKQLFLEAALSAPCGQLISIEKKENGLKESYKTDDHVSEEIRMLQKGILDYARNRAELITNYYEPISKTERAVMEYAFSEALSAAIMDKEVASVFSVEDDYCSNGSWQFDPGSNQWKIDKRNSGGGGRIVHEISDQREQGSSL